MRDSTATGFMKSIFVILLMTIAFINHAQDLSERIRLNQIGYYPHAKKIAIVETDGISDFYIQAVGDNSKILSGKLSEPRKSEFSEKKLCVADFTSFTKSGNYILVVEGVGKSYPFEIKDNVHNSVSKGSILGFYYQRASTPLSEKFAGKWHRAMGHPDAHVFVHPSAASDKRPEGTIISSPKGWYDAGDYNKYIVNSGITMATLLSAYEDYPIYYDALELTIPENRNKLPDLLDEALWNLRWMLTMQDPNDGGVYHKLTNANFDKFVMPDKATAKRYVVQKGTAATLDFAAVMAQASRVLKKFDKQLPGLSDSCITAAKEAWVWATKNPNVVYDQNVFNKRLDPDITTGGYGDQNFSDEVIWAACELYATTKDEQYVKGIGTVPDKLDLPGWNQVQSLGYYTLIRLEKELPVTISPLTSALKKKIINYAKELVQGVDQRSFITVIGGSSKDFIWGSSSVAANQGIVLLQAYRISKDKKYVDYALTNLDYLLGRNGTGYSFVTGYGDKPPMHIHHRPSEADGIADPVPGLLSGGPNPGRQDGCSYSTSVANEAFLDDVCSYATNEIAINWNAPLVYLVGGIEALQYEIGYSEKK